jgi:hypothetical protein
MSDRISIHTGVSFPLRMLDQRLLLRFTHYSIFRLRETSARRLVVSVAANNDLVLQGIGRETRGVAHCVLERRVGRRRVRRGCELLVIVLDVLNALIVDIPVVVCGVLSVVV